VERWTYECQRITQQHKPRRMFRQLIRQFVHIAVHLAIRLAYLERLFVDFVCWGRISPTSTSPSSLLSNVGVCLGMGIYGRTYHSLRILRSTRSEAEFAELGFRVGGDGVEACFGGLGAHTLASGRHRSMCVTVPWRVILLCKGRVD
jgi:hypothetical protein